MSRLLDLPFSDVRDLLQALQDAGMTIEQALDVIHNWRKAKAVVEVLTRTSSTVDDEQNLAQADGLSRPALADPPLIGWGSADPERDMTDKFIWP